VQNLVYVLGTVHIFKGTQQKLLSFKAHRP